MTDTLFARTLKRLRTERGISQAQLSERLFVDRSTITRWENGSRLPNNEMIARISDILDADINILLSATAESGEIPHIIMVDDTKIILKGAYPSWKRSCRTP